MSKDWTGAKAVQDAWETSPLLTSIAVTRPCPQCKAEPGQPCRKPNGDRYITLVGTPKHHVKRGGVKGGVR